MYKIFYPTREGKWHTSDSITNVATCGNFIIETNDKQAIHVEAGSTAKPHPVLCRRCLAKK